MGTCTATLEGHGDWVVGVSITPDGRLAVTVGSRRLRVWDLGTGVCTTSLATPCFYCMSNVGVCVTPDGRHMVYGGGGTCVVQVDGLPAAGLKADRG